MQKVVGVKFREDGKIYYFSPQNLKLKLKDKVIVSTDYGYEMGEIALAETSVKDEELVEPLKEVVRLATNQDLEKKERLKNKERETLLQAKKIIEKRKLEMDLIKVEYSFDSTKIVFTYTAEGRVDFRDLIKDLASTFKAKIELRQIGIRDEAKMFGGLGPCGKEVCCKQFLNDFGKVSIKMAKNQNIALNPTNISGLCGRLMCCLEFENEHYCETQKLMPKVGSKVLTKNGEGIVAYNNLLKRIVSVKFISEDGSNSKIEEFALEDLKFEK